MKRRRKRINPHTIALIKQISFGLLSIAIVALVLYGVWHGTRWERLTIDSIQVSGGETIDHQKVEEIVRERLVGTYLGLVPKRFAWFYPQAEISASVGELERIHDVSVFRNGPKEIQVTFDEYLPKALWCDNQEEENCLFVDKNGFAFAPAPQLSGGSFIRLMTIGRTTEVGEMVLDAEGLNFVEELIRELAEENWFVSKVEIDQASDAFIQIVDGGELKVSLKDAPANIVENLLVVLASTEFDDIQPGNFKYIDLRFGSKVYVNEELADPDVDSEPTSDLATSTEGEV